MKKKTNFHFLTGRIKIIPNKKRFFEFSSSLVMINLKFDKFDLQMKIIKSFLLKKFGIEETSFKLENPNPLKTNLLRAIRIYMMDEIEHYFNDFETINKIFSSDEFISPQNELKLIVFLIQNGRKINEQLIKESFFLELEILTSKFQRLFFKN